MEHQENQFFVDSEFLSPQALEKKHRLETDPASRKSHLEYLPGMEVIQSEVMEKVLSQMDSYNYTQYTARDVQAALEHETCSVEDFKALLSPAAEPFLEQMAQRACLETKKHFGNTVYLFTPLYIANYCENYCVYCGFNCYNHIHRMKLSMEQIEREMKVIADSGMEEILILTGESRSMSPVEYIGEACKLARRYFRNVGLEIYPVNTDEYRYLHECGADYVTVFQETYDRDKYETLHLMGHKRVWPYRFDAQERALRGGMRGVAFSALLGLADFRKDALASALHVYYLQRKYPAAEMSLSCPRLRPIVNNDKINPQDVGERQLCQVLCAYRIFLPFVGITVSSRENAAFRNGIVRIAATKISAGVSTGIGDHESKYQGKEAEDAGDEQFEISDERSLSQMYQDMAGEGLQPVLNDYLYVTQRSTDRPKPLRGRVSLPSRTGGRRRGRQNYPAGKGPARAGVQGPGNPSVGNLPAARRGMPAAQLFPNGGGAGRPGAAPASSPAAGAVPGGAREISHAGSLLPQSGGCAGGGKAGMLLRDAGAYLSHRMQAGSAAPRAEAAGAGVPCLSHSLYAIGGIGPETIGPVRAAGAAGACVMSGLMQAEDPSALVRRLREEAEL